MQVLINIFQGIGNFIVSAFTYLIDMISSLGYVLELLTYFAGNIPRYFSWLPAEYLTLVTFVFLVAVVMKVIGREG